MDPFIGQIMQVGFNFAPANWQMCQGQTLAISQNNAMFALLGTTFGGNGVNTFCLPNLQGRVGVGTGQAQSGTTYIVGETAGAESVTLTQSQMPIHNHTATFTPTGGPITASGGLNISHKDASEAGPNAGDYLGRATATSGTPQIYVPAAQAGTTVALGGVNVSVTGGVTGGSVTVAAAGGSSPVSLMQPYLALTTIIALNGIFPSRG